jgi:hypothetical protein
MIVVKLYGGLGNQMFQYAAARRLSLFRNTPLKLDLSWYDNEKDSGTTGRPFELADCFNIEAEVLANPTNLIVLNSDDRIQKLKNHIIRRPYLIRQAEQKFNFDRSLLTAPSNSYLEGYWQSEKYFNDHANSIRTDLEFKPELDKENSLILSKIISSESVSLHVRRGDYVSSASTNSFHGTTDENYYNQSIAMLRSKAKNIRFFIFSDDIEWCKNNLRVPPESTFIAHNTGVNSFKDMQLMSKCKHNIIANSSFSWWGAWLNRNKNKNIIAPKQWFNDATVNTSDLIPSGWVTL